MNTEDIVAIILCVALLPFIATATYAIYRIAKSTVELNGDEKRIGDTWSIKFQGKRVLKNIWGYDKDGNLYHCKIKKNNKIIFKDKGKIAELKFEFVDEEKDKK